MIQFMSLEEASERACEFLVSYRESWAEGEKSPPVVCFVDLHGETRRTTVPAAGLAREALLVVAGTLRAQYAVVMFGAKAAVVKSPTSVASITSRVNAGLSSAEALEGYASVGMFIAMLEHPMGVRSWFIRTDALGGVTEFEDGQQAGLENLTGCGPDGQITAAWSRAMDRTAN